MILGRVVPKPHLDGSSAFKREADEEHSVLYFVYIVHHYFFHRIEGFKNKRNNRGTKIRVSNYTNTPLSFSDSFAMAAGGY